MRHGHARTNAKNQRAPRPILAPPYAIIPHPDRQGVWVVTHWSVLAFACPHKDCGSKRGELCQDIHPKEGELGHYTSGTHYLRPEAVRGREGDAALLELSRDRLINFPNWREYRENLAHELGEN